MDPATPIQIREGQTATEAVVQRLIGLVNSGALQPGDRLQSERELTEQLQVGRTTVREALKLLTHSGLLEAKRGSGTFVRRSFSSLVASQVNWPALLSLQDVDHLLEVREALEVLAARLAAQRATDEEIEAIEAHRRLLDLSGGDSEQAVDVDLEFHRAIAVASHNPMLVQLMLMMRSVLRDYVLLSYAMADDMETTYRAHDWICRTIQSRQPEAAAAAMATHLAVSRWWVEQALAERGPGPSQAAEAGPDGAG
jgi:GntR family transcriptional repressor for pyruvate dehydrogenase complex